MDEYSDYTSTRNLANHDFPEDLESKSPTIQNYKSIFFSLPEVLIEMVFEYLLSEYSNIRRICKNFARIFDQMSYRMAWSNFPRGTIKTFKGYPNYQMIRVALIFLAVKRFSDLISPEASEFDIFLEIINYLRHSQKKNALIAISFFLKLGFISMSEIPELNLFDVLSAWSLGLLTLAKSLSECKREIFKSSISSEFSGILIAIDKGKTSLARFLINEAPNLMSSQQDYLDKIVRKCIHKKNREILELVYINHPRFNYIIFLELLAKLGYVDGLFVLKKVARKYPQNLAHTAVKHGHLEFLKGLSELGILVQASKQNESGETAVHIAVLHGETECFIYLVETLKKRMNCLNIADKNGNLPIHLAAHFKNTEILRAIIQRNPRYKPVSPFKGTISPLHIAVLSAQSQAANILLGAFPKLIKYRDSDGDTAIHLAIENADLEMLSLLINNAPAEVIKARNVQGNTALHVAARNGQIDKISALMLTNHFTGFERNCDGLTPIGLLARKYPKMSVTEFLKLFKISELEFEEAVQWKALSFHDAVNIFFK